MCDYDLELVQDEPGFAAGKLKKYREENEILIGTLAMIATGEVEYPDLLAQNVLRKLDYDTKD